MKADQAKNKEKAEKKSEAESELEREWKAFDMLKTFASGESEWHEWSTDMTVLVATRSMVMGNGMEKVDSMAITEKDVITCDEVKREMAKPDDGFDDEERWEGLEGVETVSRELYMWLGLRTGGEAKLVAGSLEEENGLMA